MLPSNVGSSSRRLNIGNLSAPLPAPAAVVVAIKAEQDVSKDPLAWALTHVVRPGDCISLLAVFPDRTSGRRLWNFPRLTGNCAGLEGGNLPERILEISESCSQMALQFNNQIQVKVRVKVVLGLPAGEVAAEAKRNGATWVILDKKLKEEQKHCIEKLSCSIVVMKGSQPKVLRLNLGYSDEPQTPYFSAASSPALDSGRLQSFRMKHATPISSPEYQSSSFSRTTGEASLSTFDIPPSPYHVFEQNPLFEGRNKGRLTPACSPLNVMVADKERLIYPNRESSEFVKSNRHNEFWVPENHAHNERAALASGYRYSYESNSAAPELMGNKHIQRDCESRSGLLKIDNSHKEDNVSNATPRDSFSMARTSSAPPPLCSICQHKTPTFGKPPRRFTYEELEVATNGFSDDNLLAQGGFGIVYRGVLLDGQVVAVKQLKFVDSQGDTDFCREVRVLSCAQHRNVVLLIGFCVEGKKRLLVYEYICNHSLDFHLHGNKSSPLDLQSRLKIAVGAARGLRYLHEDCRVGCIIHRDLRPSNILLTHDYEPLVGDFGLARLHCEWDIGVEQQVIGATGYLAPEYFNGGSITEKLDVYAFGVVLVELITGKKVKELHQEKGFSSLAQLFDPFAALESNQILKSTFSPKELQCIPHEIQTMGRAASLCLRNDPESRPSMSKVLRILEGSNTPMPIGLDLNSVGSQSGHMQGLNTRRHSEMRKCHSRKLSQ
ncbi:inactive protein kinase SELMODRAFT_444075-like [Chenopodium quinoa]|uniref:non-specific serine/threonine protein kinase n=1 Tax=Chenopodium quinoa TaxID=63459 RepID=A0A803N429_CHEQI|nr:inactive protein kinase SELMODRAFT_444075-like [Chenopodium quinoa]